jgi:hypothetical protein
MAGRSSPRRGAIPNNTSREISHVFHLTSHFMSKYRESGSDNLLLIVVNVFEAGLLFSDWWCRIRLLLMLMLERYGDSACEHRWRQ